MTTAQTLQLQQQWLPTLSSIVVDGDSFSQELIRQFDKKRSRLHAEMGGDSTSFSSDSYNSRTRTPESAAVATPQVPELAVITQDENDGDDNDSVHLRRRSAGELLRRSSAYLRAKFEAFKSIAPPPPPPPPQTIQDQQGRDISSLPPSEEQRRSVFHSWSLSKKSQQKSHPPLHANTIFNNSNSNNDPMASSSSLSSLGSLPPTKIAVNTTISIPSPYYLNQQRHDPLLQQPTPHHSSLYHYSAAVQPPVITQYPPRPLKYAPVEPISDHDIPCSNNNNDNVPNTTSPSCIDNNSNNNKRSSVPRAALGPQHHRISLPLFKMASNNNNSNNMTSSSPNSSSSSLGRRHSRRSSESDLHRLAAGAAASKSSISTWTRTARRFSQWFNCHPTNKVPPPSTTTKKGKEPRNTTTTDAPTRATPTITTTTTNLEVHSLAI